MRRLLLPAMMVCALFSADSAFAQFGLNFNGVGPVNRGMAGAATATPLDPIGAIHWNPATISALPGNQMMFGVDGILPVVDIQSSVGPFSGRNESDNGWFAAPSFGLVQHLNESWTMGMGIMTVAGFGENFPASGSNPILFPTDPPAPTPQGFGNLFSEAAFIEIAPVLSVQMTENLSVGFGPTVTLGRAQASPFPFVPPEDANGNGNFSYPDGTHSRYHWGGGFQAGAYLTTNQCWNFGVSFKSPQWFEDFTYQSVDSAGAQRDFKTKIELPAITSLGTSYTGFENLTLGADLRYIAWSNTELFGDPATFTGGALNGLGWDSTWNLSVGAQYKLSDCLTVRAGYAYGPSPIDGTPESGLNVATPLILEHLVSLGTTMQITPSLAMHVAYSHGFENELNDSIQTAAGAVPGSSVTQKVSAHLLTAGFSASF